MRYGDKQYDHQDQERNVLFLKNLLIMAVFTIATSPLLLEDLVCQRDQMLPAIEDVWSIQQTVILDILPWWDGRVCGGMFPLSGLFG